MDTSPQVYRLFDQVTAGAPGPVPFSAVYADLHWPTARSADRPYVAMNMVTTLDGKVVVGGAGTTTLIGSDVDHALMERINLQADAILGGAGTVRADGLRYPKITAATERAREERGLRPRPLWIVVSRRGEMPLDAPFFRTDRANLAAIVSGAASRSQVAALDERAQVIRVEAADGVALDAHEVLATLRHDWGVQRLVCLGGPRTNAWLIEAGLVDELFLTIAPKIQGSADAARLRCRGPRLLPSRARPAGATVGVPRRGRAFSALSLSGPGMKRIS